MQNGKNLITQIQQDYTDFSQQYNLCNLIPISVIRSFPLLKDFKNFEEKTLIFSKLPCEIQRIWQDLSTRNLKEISGCIKLLHYIQESFFLLG